MAKMAFRRAVQYRTLQYSMLSVFFALTTPSHGHCSANSTTPTRTPTRSKAVSQSSLSKKFFVFFFKTFFLFLFVFGVRVRAGSGSGSRRVAAAGASTVLYCVVGKPAMHARPAWLALHTRRPPLFPSWLALFVAVARRALPLTLLSVRAQANATHSLQLTLPRLSTRQFASNHHHHQHRTAPHRTAPLNQAHSAI